MNPRYRRLIIPGLLVALLVVVVVASLTGRARADDDGGYVSGGDDSTGAVAEHERVSVVRDRRVGESSGLVVSTRDPRLAYTMNDSGNDPVVFVVEIATGDVVGTTRLRGEGFEDVEALAVDGDGTLWIGDVGDNDGVRDDLAVYSTTQPRRGDRTATPRRFPVAYPDGVAEDAEALLADPVTGRLSVVTKGFLGGSLYRLPARLGTDRVNPMTVVDDFRAPLLVTDGSFLPNGSTFLLRTYIGVFAYDARTLERTWAATLPSQPQGETLAVEPGGGSALIGTEGVPSPLERITLPAAATGVPAGLVPAGGVVNAAA
ncbi:hypothetical protein [Solicola sp. PLA-1-18]|uniref:hypothetical protein n=1 Tax=Solicola sp. PLA-1-18 TaxID=3380532 RepID=UPI003B7AFC2F